MTKKHFIQLARICLDYDLSVEVCKALAEMCKENNDRFDLFKFLRACGLEQDDDGNWS